MEVKYKMTNSETGAFSIKSLEVRRGVSFEEDETNHLLEFSIKAEIHDEKAISHTKATLENLIERWLASEPRDPGLLSTELPLDFDIEKLPWKQSSGKESGKPFDLIYIKDKNTRDLADFISDHKLCAFGGFDYWIMPDGKAIGRRRIR